jgi:hypothetical protein
MALSKRDAAAFEIWRQKEVERMKSLQRQEMGVLIEKIRKQWGAQQARVTKEWEDKESRIFDCFTKIETAVCEFKATNAECQNLQKQQRALEQENDELKQVPADAARQERLVRINNLRLEIQQLEGNLTKVDAELRVANESKNRYKRLFLESNSVLSEMLEEQKPKQRCRPRQ